MRENALYHLTLNFLEFKKNIYKKDFINSIQNSLKIFSEGAEYIIEYKENDQSKRKKIPKSSFFFYQRGDVSLSKEINRKEIEKNHFEVLDTVFDTKYFPLVEVKKNFKKFNIFILVPFVLFFLISNIFFDFKNGILITLSLLLNFLIFNTHHRKISEYKVILFLTIIYFFLLIINFNPILLILLNIMAISVIKIKDNLVYFFLTMLSFLIIANGDISILFLLSISLILSLFLFENSKNKYVILSIISTFLLSFLIIADIYRLDIYKLFGATDFLLNLNINFLLIFILLLSVSFIVYNNFFSGIKSRIYDLFIFISLTNFLFFLIFFTSQEVFLIILYFIILNCLNFFNDISQKKVT